MMVVRAACSAPRAKGEAVGWPDGKLFDELDLVVCHRHQVEIDVAGLETGCRVGEDQTAFLGESEQRPQRAGDVVATIAVQRCERRVDVGLGDISQMAVLAGPLG
ncbi:hypothetical protein AB4305_28920 [Nocardia sp. 2YAB30]|uniref:hypothetical protein n=1 Tax=Nocardia sp. 2YAB30 TaxID=3233022 RepID=UPI003F9E3B55